MGFHGRDRWVTPAMCLLLLVLFSVPGGTQTATTIDDLPAAIVLKPLFSQRVQILDVALINRVDGPGLLVLDRSGVTRYAREQEFFPPPTVPRWRTVESVPLPARVWPRDLRGHLIMGSGQDTVLLPGTDCIAQFGPLRMTCTEARAFWGYGIPNRGLEPNRNYFTTPEGATFYGSVKLLAGDGQGYIAADGQGRLMQLDADRRPVADLGAGDDVVPLQSPCGRRLWHYLAASHGPGGDVLRAFKVEDGRLVQSAPEFPLPGTFIALSNVDLQVFVITRLSGADRYDAFQADISCGR